MSETDGGPTDSSQEPRKFASRRVPSHYEFIHRYSSPFDITRLTDASSVQHFKDSLRQFLNKTRRLSRDLMLCDIKAGPDVFSELKYWDVAGENFKTLFGDALRIADEITRLSQSNLICNESEKQLILQAISSITSNLIGCTVYLEGVNYEKLEQDYTVNSDGENVPDGASYANFDTREILDRLHDIGRSSKLLVDNFERDLENIGFGDGYKPKKQPKQKERSQTRETKFDTPNPSKNANVFVNIKITSPTVDEKQIIGTASPDKSKHERENDAEHKIKREESGPGSDGDSERSQNDPLIGPANVNQPNNIAPESLKAEENSNPVVPEPDTKAGLEEQSVRTEKSKLVSDAGNKKTTRPRQRSKESSHVTKNWCVNKIISILQKAESDMSLSEICKELKERRKRSKRSTDLPMEGTIGKYLGELCGSKIEINGKKYKIAGGVKKPDAISDTKAG